MGLRYKIEYKTDSDIPCEILLDEKGYSGNVMELIAGGDPFKINTDTSDLLAPIRASSATLSVCGSDYLQDLYTSDPQGVEVTVKVGGNTHWIGFLTPDTFSQDFSRPEFIYEMECVSALSTLKYKEFDLTADFVSFKEIITRASVYAGYDLIYLTNSVRTSSGMLYDLSIASANFFDELGEAMNYYEVLEEIAKFLGCTFTPFEDDLYLLDYAAIKGNYNAFTKIDGGSNPSLALYDAKTVTGYKGTGAKLSRIAGKNKATVNCSLYEVDKAAVEFDDKESVFNDTLKASFELERKNSTGGKDYGNRYFVLRLFDQPKYDFYKYRVSGDSLILDSKTSEALKLNQIGSGFARRVTYEIWPGQPAPTRLDFSKEVIVRTGGDKNNIMGSNHPVISIKSKQNILSSPGNFFALSFSYMAQLNDWWYNRDPWLDAESILTMYASLKIGNLYYNGNSWVNNQSKFPIRFDINGKLIGVWHTVRDENTFEKGMPDATGKLIPTPNSIVSGEVELTIYQDDWINTRLLLMPGNSWSQYAYYKDISLTYCIPDEQSIYGDWVDNDSKNDLIYENVIEGDYVEEADEIDLKICTNPDGKLALSSVLNNGQFLKNITTDVFGTGKAEEILLKRVIQMFSKPRFVIDPTLKNDAKPYTVFTEPYLGKQFMVAGGEEDIKMERTHYNLIEL